MTLRPLLALAVAAIVVVVLGGMKYSPSVLAANPPLVVTNLADSGPGSLRAAIAAANTTNGPDTVTLVVSGTILPSTSFNIQDEGTTITALGQEIVVDGSNALAPNNIFQVASASAAFAGFTIQNAKNNGISVSPAFNGGCIGATSGLSLSRMTLKGNAESGLLLCAASASNVTITDSEFLGNAVGLSVRPGSAVGTSVRHSRFEGNTVAAVAIDSGPEPFVPGGTMNAEENWWGCAAGPGNPGCDALVHPELIDATPHLAVDAIRVTTLAADGVGSLRWAVDEANQRGGPDTIRFALSGTIALSGPALGLTDPGTSIDATGRSVVVDGSGMDVPSNVFQVTAPSAGFTGFTVEHARNIAISIDSPGCSDLTAALAVTGMTLRGNLESGLGLCASGFANTTIAENRFVSNQTGIVVAPQGSGALSLHDNSFTGNLVGIANFGAGTTDATGNWWGCNAGPGSAGCDATAGAVDFSGFIANTLLVTSLLDDATPGTLRWAIQEANADPDPNVISFDVDGTIVTTGTLVISGTGTTIDVGNHAITLSPPPSVNAILVAAENTALRGLAIHGGSGLGVQAGACDGTLTGLILDRVTVTDSSGQSLNVCARSVANLSITDSTFTGSVNTGIQICHCDPADTALDLTDVQVLNTTITAGRAGLQLGVGGGTDPVTLTRLLVENSSITGTGSTPGPGPGQGLSYTGGPMTATDVRIAASSFNSAPGAAALAIEANGDVTGSGLTISGNHFTNTVQFSGAAGGSLDGITIEGNTVTSPPGRAGIRITVSDGSIANVLIGRNPSIVGGAQAILVGSPAGGSSTVSNFQVIENGSIQGGVVGGTAIGFFGLAHLSTDGVVIERNNVITGGSAAPGASAAGVFIGSFAGTVMAGDVSISHNGSISGGTAGILIGNDAGTAIIDALAINSHADVHATAPGGSAIDLRGRGQAGGNTISDNAMAGSSVGIKLMNGNLGTPMLLSVFGNQIADHTTAGIVAQEGADANVQIHLNSFAGNAVGIQQLGQGALMAEWNWWGCEEGPGAAGCDTIAEDVPGAMTFDPWLRAPIVGTQTSVAIEAFGAPGSANLIPDGDGSPTGVTAVATTDGSNPTTVTVSTYAANPATTVFDTGGGFVDIYVSDSDAVVTVTSSFYYPASVTGQAEQDLVLMYFDSTDWVPVFSGGGVVPVKDTTDNLDGSVSGGRFVVTFDATSTPQAAELNGTMLTMTFASPGTLEIDEAGTTGAVWLGTPVPMELAAQGRSLNDLPGPISAVFAWNNGQQRFDFWFRGFPVGFQTLTTGLVPGGYYFFQSAGPASVPMSGGGYVVPQPGDSFATTVAGAWGNVWAGTDTPIAGLDALTGVSAIFGWSNNEQRFDFWFRGFPDAFQTLDGLDRGDYYFFQTPGNVTVVMN